MTPKQQSNIVRTGLTAILIVGGLAAVALAHPGARHRVKAEVKGTVESISNDRWVVAGRTFVVTPRTDVEDYPRVGDYVKVEAEEETDGTWVASEIDRKRRPWRPASSVKLRLEGAIEAMSGNTWTVAGREFDVTPRTSMEDSVWVGAYVKVDAYEGNGGKLVATEVDSKEKRRGW